MTSLSPLVTVAAPGEQPERHAPVLRTVAALGGTLTTFTLWTGPLRAEFSPTAIASMDTLSMCPASSRAASSSALINQLREDLL